MVKNIDWVGGKKYNRFGGCCIFANKESTRFYRLDWWAIFAIRHSPPINSMKSFEIFITCTSFCFSDYALKLVFCMQVSLQLCTPPMVPGPTARQVLSGRSWPLSQAECQPVPALSLPGDSRWRPRRHWCTRHSSAHLESGEDRSLALCIQGQQDNN